MAIAAADTESLDWITFPAITETHLGLTHMKEPLISLNIFFPL
jgi:hypothetical protein